jgi:glycosyltransferase involved in cell wall biosynthesis
MLLTAIIPAHNAADTLEAALVSILNQEFQDVNLGNNS